MTTALSTQIMNLNKIIPPNDWKIRNCLVLYLTLMLALFGLIEMSLFGFDVPFLRQIVGFLFLTFVPGMLILRILKIHNINMGRSILYSVGLSITFIIFTGVLINFVLPFFNITKPLSLLPILSTFIVFTLVLMGVAYKRDGDFATITESKPNEIHYSPVLLLILLLVLDILGILLSSFYHNNTILLVVILLMAGVIGITAFGKFFTPKIYPLATFIIGLSLLYQTNLMYPVIGGHGINNEYYFSRLVIDIGYWDPSIQSNINSSLNSAILVPIYSIVLKIGVHSIFNIFYPILFSLVPLSLFYIYQQYMYDTKAFFSVLFFITMPAFFMVMYTSARDQIAELFFVLFILILFDRQIHQIHKSVFCIIFLLLVPVSAYGFGSLSLVYFSLGLIFLMLLKSNFGLMSWGWLSKGFGGLSSNLKSSQLVSFQSMMMLTLIYAVFTISWYMYISSGSVFDALVTISKNVFDVSTGGRGPIVQTAMGFDFNSVSVQGKVFRVLQIITQIFLIIGFFRWIFIPKDLKFPIEYLALSGVGVIVMLLAIILPGFAALGAGRIYNFALILLAPLFIIGGETVWWGMIFIWQKVRYNACTFVSTENSQDYIAVVAIFLLIPYFLFTSGFIYEITKQKTTDKYETPISISLSNYRVDYAPTLNWKDAAGANWIQQKITNEHKIHADRAGWTRLTEGTKTNIGEITLLMDRNTLSHGDYLYLRTWNTQMEDLGLGIYMWSGLIRHVRFDEIPVLLQVNEYSNSIYNNGGAQIIQLKIQSR